MKIAFDTSVLVAAAVRSHPRHEEAAALLERASEERHIGFFCTHGLAEVYSVLTKIPLEQRITPVEALSFLQALQSFLRVVPCNGPVYEAAIRRCAERNLGSGVAFDALHLVAAESIQANVLVTFNVRDFERLRDTQSPRIAETLTSEG